MKLSRSTNSIILLWRATCLTIPNTLPVWWPCFRSERSEPAFDDDNAVNIHSYFCSPTVKFRSNVLLLVLQLHVWPFQKRLTSIILSISVRFRRGGRVYHHQQQQQPSSGATIRPNFYGVCRTRCRPPLDYVFMELGSRTLTRAETNATSIKSLNSINQRIRLYVTQYRLGVVRV